MMKQLNPETILSTKDDIHQLWDMLPPEHQSALLLVLINQTLQSDYREWLIDVMQLLTQSAEQNP